MKRYLLPVSLFLVSLFLTLLVMECFCRVFWSNLSGELIPLSLEIHQQSPNRLLAYELIPDSSVEQDDVVYHINSAGWRDYPHMAEPDPDTIRIAAIGDSFTFGLGMSLEKTWPKQLEQIFQSRGNRSIRVYNFGVMGYDTIQETELLRTRVPAYEPDLIVVGYCLNDIGIFSREGAEVKHFRGYHDFLRTHISFLDRILEHSKLFRFIKDRWYLDTTRTKMGYAYMDLSHDAWEAINKGYSQYLFELYKQPQKIESLRDNLLALHEVTSALNLPALVCLFPEIEPFKNYRYREVHHLLERMIREAGMEALDLLPAMSRFTPEMLRISAKNLHPNEFGHEVAATEIYNFLIGRYHHLSGPRSDDKRVKE